MDKKNLKKLALLGMTTGLILSVQTQAHCLTSRNYNQKSGTSTKNSYTAASCSNIPPPNNRYPSYQSYENENSNNPVNPNKPENSYYPTLPDNPDIPDNLNINYENKSTAGEESAKNNDDRPKPQQGVVRFSPSTMLGRFKNCPRPAPKPTGEIDEPILTRDKLLKILSEREKEIYLSIMDPEQQPVLLNKILLKISTTPAMSTMEPNSPEFNRQIIKFFYQSLPPELIRRLNQPE